MQRGTASASASCSSCHQGHAVQWTVLPPLNAHPLCAPVRQLQEAAKDAAARSRNAKNEAENIKSDLDKLEHDVRARVRT